MTAHSHGSATHEHGAAGDDHDHLPPEGHLWHPEALDATGTTCGHAGDDEAVVRHVIHHRGQEKVLCAACGASDHWAAWDAEIDAAAAADAEEAFRAAALDAPPAPVEEEAPPEGSVATPPPTSATDETAASAPSGSQVT